MSGTILELPYCFTVHARMRRARGARSFQANDLLVVELPELADPVLVAEETVGAASHRVLHDGHGFLAPLTIGYHDAQRIPRHRTETTIEAIVDVASGTSNLRFPDWLGWPAMTEGLDTIAGRMRDFPSGFEQGFAPIFRLDGRVAEIVQSAQEEARAKAMEAAARLAVHDGVVYVRVPEPTFGIWNRDVDAPEGALVWDPRDDHWIHLGLQHVASGPTGEDRSIVVHRPDLCTFDHWSGNVPYVLQETSFLVGQHSGRTANISDTRTAARIALACREFLEGASTNASAVYDLVSQIDDTGQHHFEEMTKFRNLLTSIDERARTTGPRP